MPQIDQILETYSSQIFWLVIIFGLIYFGIGRAMLPKVAGTVDARDRKIAEDLATAERARATADQIEADYRARIAEARGSAQIAAQEAKSASAAEAEARVKAADAELSGKTAEAEARLRKAQADALSGIEDVAAEAAQDIVSRISGASVSREEAARAVKAALVNG